MLHQSESTKNFQTPFFSDKKQKFSIVDIRLFRSDVLQKFKSPKQKNLSNSERCMRTELRLEAHSGAFYLERFSVNRWLLNHVIWDSVWTSGSCSILYGIQCEQVALVACYMGFSVNRWLL